MRNHGDNVVPWRLGEERHVRRWLLISEAKPVEWSSLLLKLQEVPWGVPSLTVAPLTCWRDPVSGSDWGAGLVPCAPRPLQSEGEAAASAEQTRCGITSSLPTLECLLCACFSAVGVIATDPGTSLSSMNVKRLTCIKN